MGTMMPRATYNIVRKATNPIKKMEALIKNGNCISFVITFCSGSFLFAEKMLKNKLAD